MSTIVTRSGKGVPLTATDHDNNVNNLNTDKVETLADLSITSTATEINLLDGVTATTAELNYVDGVTSNIQTQLGTKLPLAGGTMTGTIAGFSSTGIDDNATSTAITIDASENVGVGTASPTGGVSVASATYLGAAATTGSKITLNSENTASWVGTRELISLESVGNGADHRTGSLSLKLKTNAADTSLQEYMYVNAVSGYTAFSTGGTERLRITANGLTFNGDTAAANALDDYEEGTWEIVVKDSAGNLATTNNKTMNYTKIGRSVHVHGYFDLANIGAMVGTNTLQFYGLPFAAANTAGYSEASIGVFIPGRMTFSTTSQLFVTIDALNSHMNVRVSNSGGLQASHLVSDTGGTMYGTLSMTYTAA